MSKVTQLMPERAGVETQVCLAPGIREEGPASERSLMLPVSFRTALALLQSRTNYSV